MAAPVTLTAWRAFIDRPDPRPPARLTRAAMRRLSTTAKDAYGRDRLAWLGADVVFATRDLPDLELLTTIATRRNSVEAVGPRRGIAISGPSTVGKTTALLHLGRRHETWVRQTQADYPGLQPVAYIVVPPASTPRMMLTAFARFLGLPTSGSARLNSDGLSDVCAAVLTESGTSMIIVDEVHNLRTNRQAGVEAASALKIFGDRINATFLYGGIDLDGSDMFTGELGRQIAGRVVLHPMRPYRFRTPGQQQEWIDLIGLCENHVILADHRPGMLANQAAYLHERVGGSIGSLRALIGDATARAILTGHETLTRTLLDQTPTDQRAETSGERPTQRSAGSGATRGRSSCRSWTTTSRSERSSVPPTRLSRSTPATGVRSGPVDTSRPTRPRSSACTWSPGRWTRPGKARHDGR